MQNKYLYLYQQVKGPTNFIKLFKQILLLNIIVLLFGIESEEEKREEDKIHLIFHSIKGIRMSRQGEHGGNGERKGRGKRRERIA